MTLLNTWKQLPKVTIILGITALVSVLLFLILRQIHLPDDTFDTPEAQLAVKDSGLVQSMEIYWASSGKSIQLYHASSRWSSDLFQGKLDKPTVERLLHLIYHLEPIQKLADSDQQFALKNLMANGLRLTSKVLPDSPPLQVVQLWLDTSATTPTLVAMNVDQKTPFICQASEEDIYLMSTLLSKKELALRDRVVFVSTLSDLDTIMVQFSKQQQHNYLIYRKDDKFAIKDVPSSAVDSLRLYSFLQLFEQVPVAAYCTSTFSHALDSIYREDHPAFVLDMKTYKTKSHWEIYYKEGQKGKVYCKLNGNEWAEVKTSLFEYILQKRSFFLKK